VINARRVGAALRELGFRELARAWRCFARPECFARLGLPPLQIDVLTSSCYGAGADGAGGAAATCASA
jgi:hypothetical protein